MVLAEIFEKDSFYFAVKRLEDVDTYILIEDKICKGQRKKIYLVRGISSHRYVTVHTTKNNKICSIRGHKSKPCEHKHLIPLHFRGETLVGTESWWDLDEYAESENEEKDIGHKNIEFDEVLLFIFFKKNIFLVFFFKKNIFLVFFFEKKHIFAIFFSKKTSLKCNRSY